MGTCWEGKRMVCDFCSRAPGGVRKVRCPFGYCPSVAACADCRKSRKDKLGRAFHVGAGCDQKHAAYVAQEKERENLLATGRKVRSAAVSAKVDGFDVVKVWFRGFAFLGEGCKLGLIDHEFYMAPETYSALPLGKNATIEDYMAHGMVLPAPGKDA